MPKVQGVNGPDRTEDSAAADQTTKASKPKELLKSAGAEIATAASELNYSFEQARENLEPSVATGIKALTVKFDSVPEGESKLKHNNNGAPTINNLVVEVVPTFAPNMFLASHLSTGEAPTTLPFKISIVADGKTIVASDGLTLSKRQDKQLRPIYEWAPQHKPLETAQLTPTRILPDLGSYHDKLSKLQDCVASAGSALQKELDSVIRGRDQLKDRQLFLLKNMKQYLQTDDNGSLKNDEGFVRFFTALTQLRESGQFRFSKVIQAADALTGFSYLTPPDPNKPILIHIPGAGGEPGWRGARELLAKQAENYTIVGYAYDPVTPSAAEMTEKLRTEFVRSGFHEQQTVTLALSMGATLFHNAALQESRNKTSDTAETIFSKTQAICAGFLPGGASRVLDLPKIIVTLAPHAYPVSSGIIHVMDPDSSINRDISQNIGDIHEATRSISYVQAREDRYLGRGIVAGDEKASRREKEYVHYRDTALRHMADITYVDPPNSYIPNNMRPEDPRDNNPHASVLYAPEINDKLTVLAGTASPSLKALELVIEVSPQNVIRLPIQHELNTKNILVQK